MQCVYECIFVSRSSGERMDYGHDKIRMNAEGDRLSSLPDDLIHKILSFFSIKYAIETSVLSSRWRSIWTSMPYLNFSSDHFLTLSKFSKFVTHVLSSRNNQIEVSSVKLNFRGKSSHAFVKRILTYAFSHNVQQLTVTYWLKKQQIEFPLSLLSSQSLKNLSLTGSCNLYSIILASTWDLPALTTLHLDYVALSYENTDKCVGIFSMYPNLKNLTLNYCCSKESDGFSICHPRLSNLTLKKGYWSRLNVVAPQLANFTLQKGYWSPLISAPDGFCSLEKVDLCIDYPSREDGHKIVGLLQQFHNVKFLTLNLEIVELLSSSLELISHQTSPFDNLKSLKIYPAHELSDAHKKVPMSTEVKNYLFDNSPSATFTMISREDIRDVRNTTLAQNLMAKLQVLLEQQKANSETNMAHMARGKAPMESHKAKMQVQHEKGNAQVEKQRAQSGTKMQLHIGRRMTQIEGYWEDLCVQIMQGKAKTCGIISMLQQIEVLVLKLPTTQRAKMQARFSSMCAEADIVLNNIIDRTKIKCHKKRKYLLS